MKISITGDLGSGKSSVGKALSEKLGIEFLSTGQVFRNIAENKNMTVLELNMLAEQDNRIDNEIDGALKSLAYKDISIIIDSRLAWYFVPDAYKIYIKVDTETAARRIMNSNRGNVENYKSIEEAVKHIKKRAEAEIERYKYKYNVDLSNYDNYDLVVDSTNMDIDGVVQELLKELKRI